MDEPEFSSELARLAAEVEGLKLRLLALEGVTVGQEAHAAAPVELEEAAGARRPYSHYFTRLALGCFCLLGALVLRVATQKGWWQAPLGTGLGLAYAAVLLLVPVLLRRWLLSAHGIILQLCGAVLAPLIVLETFHTGQWMSPLVAASIGIGFGVFGGGLAALCGSRGLAGLCLSGGLVCLAGIGIETDAAVPRAVGVALLGSLAFCLAHLRGWARLRPLVGLPALVLIGVALLATARREGLGEWVAVGLMASAVFMWLTSLVNHALRSGRLAGPEAVWLPLATVWIVSLGLFYSAQLAAPICLGLGGVLLGIAFWLSWDRAQPIPALIGLAAAGGLAAGLGVRWFDPSGLGLGMVALLLWFAGRPLRANSLALVVQILLIFAVFDALARGGLWTLSAQASWLAGLAGVGLTAVLFVHYVLVSRAPERASNAGRWLSPLSLAAGALVLFALLRGVAWSCLGPGQGFALSMSLFLAAFGFLALTLGLRFERLTLSVLGWGAVGLLSVKVLLSDLFNLSGAPLLGSVLSLAVAFVAASLVLRKRSARAGSSEKMDPSG